MLRWFLVLNSYCSSRAEAAALAVDLQAESLLYTCKPRACYDDYRTLMPDVQVEKAEKLLRNRSKSDERALRALPGEVARCTTTDLR